MSLPARHRLPGPRESFEKLVQNGAEKIARRLSSPQWVAGWTATLQRSALNNSAMRSYLDPADPAIAYELEVSACAAAAAHLAALTPGTDPIRAPAPGGQWVEVIRTAGKPKQLSPSVQWREGVLAAAVSRNAAALESLTNMRAEDLIQLTNRLPPPWFQIETRTLAALFQRAGDASALLLTAAQAIDSDRVDDSAKNLVRDIIVPEMELGLRAVQASREKLDAAMADALVHHHHFYATDGKDDYLGQLALAPLAMACFAHDLGVATSVASDYAPRWLIERTEP